jgi:hypothetical protein
MNVIYKQMLPLGWVCKVKPILYQKGKRKEKLNDWQAMWIVDSSGLAFGGSSRNKYANLAFGD